MTDHQCLQIRHSIGFLGLVIFIATAAITFSLKSTTDAIKALKPTMHVTQNPVTVKVVEAPRPSGLLPGVR